ncbi:GIY-YIG nuclease family protein [Streptomyces sp. ISL-36]|uniref:GIY-YIG nuclease family protein n=1 Tax=Streptomyces sp. ISL-36 TaxID=2819182 RepID=UPI001BEB196E|nr:GIY-YIG nuclease family protein [Streptomyces sp. ISL-36]MBT2439944.1 GIY-YIG nuclease family protein [Streptomyces sp. ISL-36]
MENLTGPRRDQPLQTSPSDALREEAEVTSRMATDAELEAFGYKGPVVVTQIVRTTFRADGTPIGKSLTVQGGSTELRFYQDAADVEDDDALLPPAEVQAAKVPAPRSWRTYLLGMEGSALTKIGHTTDTLKGRVAQLQTGQPAALQPLLEVDGDYERSLHTRFEDYRLRGEWFDLTPLGDPVTVVVEALMELGVDTRPRLHHTEGLAP